MSITIRQLTSYYLVRPGNDNHGVFGVYDGEEVGDTAAGLRLPVVVAVRYQSAAL